MNKSWPSSCYGAASGMYRSQHLDIRLLQRRQLYRSPTRAVHILRGYATKHGKQDPKAPEKAALRATAQPSRALVDLINPPRSTLPAPLTLPERGGENVFVYYFRIGRAYGGFYWMGIKAVWFNRQAANALRSRIDAERGGSSGSNADTAAKLPFLTRSEYQLLERNAYDIGKLPLFAVLVALFGEWLPLLVPFIPSAVPGTCRIPQQIRGMREKAEERRRVSFRQGITGPTAEQLSFPPSTPSPSPMSSSSSSASSSSSSSSSTPTAATVEWPMTQRAHVASTLERLRTDQLLHLSAALNVHNRLWDRVQLAPPASLLRRGLAKRLVYIASDDFLLTRDGGVAKLEVDELSVACEQRGIDVLGRREDALRSTLTWWLARQQEDQGQGAAILSMLFRRPNAWWDAPSGHSEK